MQRCKIGVPLMPVADSMYAVTGLTPKSAPILIEKASTQYAIVEPSKSKVTGSRRPANLAMEYRVLKGMNTMKRISEEGITRWYLNRY